MLINEDQPDSEAGQTDEHLAYTTRCCNDLTSKVLKERTFGQSSAVLYPDFSLLGLMKERLNHLIHDRSREGNFRRIKL